MIKDLPTAAKMSSMSPELKAKIAKRSRTKGSDYERQVAKKIASYFGWKWDQAFFRTKPHGMAQPNGDLQPINEMNDLWRAAKLGPIECKNRAEWSFGQIFKNPEKSKLYEYWLKSNEDTKKDNTVLFFTKNGLPDLVMEKDDVTSLNTYSGSILSFFVQGKKSVLLFRIVTLRDFLTARWPRQ